MKFLSDIDRDLKASLGSVKITSGAVGGGGFISLIGIVGFCFLLYRRSGQNRPQSQPEAFDEFDLPTEQSEEEEFEHEEENGFGLENGKDSDSDDAFDSESFERDRNPGERDLRMDFDGDESFARWGM
jgi:hypothetical protein